MVTTAEEVHCSSTAGLPSSFSERLPPVLRRLHLLLPHEQLATFDEVGRQ